MRIFVRVKTGAREEKVQELDETHFSVSVEERPIDGKANRAVLEAVARHFRISPSRVAIVSGSSSREKCIDVAL